MSQEALHSCLVKLNVFKGSLPQEPLEGRWRCWTYPWVMRRVLYNYCSSLIHILDHQLVCHAIRGAISWLYLPLTSALTASSKAHNSTACFAQNFTRSRTIKLATTWWTSQHERNAHQIEVKCKHFWVVSAIFSMVANLNQAPAMHKKNGPFTMRMAALLLWRASPLHRNIVLISTNPSVVITYFPSTTRYIHSRHQLVKLWKTSPWFLIKAFLNSFRLHPLLWN